MENKDFIDQLESIFFRTFENDQPSNYESPITPVKNKKLSLRVTRSALKYSPI